MASLSKLNLTVLLLAAIAPSQARQCLPAYQATTSYVGCYHDPLEPRDLSGPFLTVGNTNSPQHCANLCGAAGYKFAGVEFAIQCFCGQKIEDGSVKAGENECTTPCPADPSAICGGGNMINIYQITNPASKPLNPALPDCTRDPLCSNDVCDTTLSIGERASAIVKAMTTDEKIANLNSGAPGSAGKGLPPHQWQSEALHGYAGTFGAGFQQPLGVVFSAATSFPMPVLMSAAFDDELIQNIGRIIGTEARAFANAGFSGFDVWTPNINGFRDPRWGRGQETPGEDPFRISNYVAAFVNGLQGGPDSEYLLMAATCKHFAAYDVENGRTANDVSPTRQDMADYYLPMFWACVHDGQAVSVMCAYNSVDGVPACANTYLMKAVLRDSYSFNQPWNYVVSDCDSVDNIFQPHGYASDLAQASAFALEAGTDLDCGTTYGDNLKTSLQRNLITEAAIDTSLTRLHAALIRTGWYDQPEDLAILSWDHVNTTTAQHTAYLSAVEGFTLLKNDGTLPLSASLKTVAVIGPYANATTQMLGNYAGTPPLMSSPLSAFKAKFQNVNYAFGTDINSGSTSGFAAALTAAKNSDAIVFLGGLDGSVENEGFDRSNINWPGNQLDLISQLSALSKPLIVVKFGGGQVDDSVLLANKNVRSILWVGYPGQDGGNAIYDSLTGVYPPAGRLPITQYPSNYTNNLSTLDMNLRPGGNNHGRTYQWFPGAILPFGYGLSYTTWKLAWKTQPPSSTAVTSLGKTMSVAVTVQNTGSRASDYVVLAFVASANSGPGPHQIKRLVSYKRLKSVAAGQTVQVQLDIAVDTLARADDTGNRWIWPGDWTLTIDTQSLLKASFELTGKAKQYSTLPAQ